MAHLSTADFQPLRSANVQRRADVVAQGDPHEIVTADLVAEVFGLPCRVIPDPETGTPLVVPSDRRRRSGRWAEARQAG